MKKTLNKKSARRKRKVMSPEERLRKKEQRDQMKEIRDIMFRIGFTRLSGIDGKEFVYDGRTSELDDIFICENVILLTEYTIGDPHILKKKIIYDKINSDIHAFVKYLIVLMIYIRTVSLINILLTRCGLKYYTVLKKVFRRNIKIMY